MNKKYSFYAILLIVSVSAMIASDKPSILASVTIGEGSIKQGSYTFSSPQLDLLGSEKLLKTTSNYNLQVQSLHKLKNGNLGLTARLSVPDGCMYNLRIGFTKKEEVENFIKVLQETRNTDIPFNLRGKIGSHDSDFIVFGFSLKKSELKSIERPVTYFSSAMLPFLGAVALGFCFAYIIYLQSKINAFC